jgi:enoyl-CoA hydratase
MCSCKWRTDARFGVSARFPCRGKLFEPHILVQVTVHYEADESVAVITIDRPEVANAVDRPTAEALADAFRRFEQSDHAAVAVLTGANDTFCAGADLKAMQEPGAPRASRVQPDGDGPVGPTRMLLGKPVIAAVEGHAVAGGLELAIWCDLRVAAEDAVFGVYCRRWGIPLMDGGTIRLARLIGHSHALDLILTGRGVSGEEAQMMGLANRLVPAGEALSAATDLAAEIAAKPQAALRNDRLSSYEQWSLPLEEALANEFRHGMATLETGELFGGLDRYASGEWRSGKAG